MLVRALCCKPLLLQSILSHSYIVLLAIGARSVEINSHCQPGFFTSDCRFYISSAVTHVNSHYLMRDMLLGEVVKVSNIPAHRKGLGKKFPRKYLMAVNLQQNNKQAIRFVFIPVIITGQFSPLSSKK